MVKKKGKAIPKIHKMTLQDLSRIKECLGISQNELAGIFNVDVSVLEAPEKFSKSLAQLCCKTEILMDKANSIFTQKGVGEWFHQPCLEFENRSPLELLKEEEGIQKVSSLLEMIEWGAPV